MYYSAIIPIGNIKHKHIIKMSYEGKNMIKVSIPGCWMTIEYTKTQFTENFVYALLNYGWTTLSINLLEKTILQDPSKWESQITMNATI